MPDDSWETRFYWQLVRDRIEPHEKETLYEYTVEKVAERGYEDIYVLTLLKLGPDYNQFLFSEEYLPLALPVLIRHHGLIPQAVLAAACSQLAESENVISLEQLMILYLLAGDHNPELADRLVESPLLALLVAMARRANKAKASHPVDLQAVAILLDHGVYEEALELLNSLRLDPKQAKPFRDHAVLHLQGQTEQPSLGFFSMLKQTFSKQEKTQKAQELIESGSRVYDAKAGRWLIDGKVPSDE